MTKITNEEINQAVDMISEFKQIQSDQKKLGLNDVNVFTTLLSSSDEVRLHSRFIKFLLDPNENHYQGDLFLKLFLRVVGLDNFGIDTENLKVYNEYANIDIYLTDGNNHIILENKIWAGDQYEQIERYINTVKEKNKQINNENLAVIYLTPTGWELSERSLKGDDEKGYIVKDNNIINIENHEEKYQYKKISYKDHIIKWLDNILNDLGINNLSVIITQYKETVEKVLGTYKGNIMTLETYIENKEDKQKIIKNLEEITVEYKQYKLDLMKGFWSNIQKEINSQIEGWECDLHNIWKLMDGTKDGASPFRLYQVNKKEEDQVNYKEKGAFIGFEYNKDQYQNPHLGICLCGNFNIGSLKKSLGNSIEVSSSTWWVNWEEMKFVSGKNLYEEIIGQGEEKFIKEFIRYFEANENIVKEINTNLEKYLL